ncbi:hypothetical protein MNBD_GAMMA22-1641 [hydrothermal vent metagenome]|uniref:Lipoprotein n=1 Tax=hydrothermal vent metagenome TaxID=652676 RepID=A0A3B1A4X0_9ZZZZ
MHNLSRLSRNTFLTLLLLILSISILSACGKKGGLYLPVAPAQEVQAEVEKAKKPEQDTPSSTGDDEY